MVIFLGCVVFFCSAVSLFVFFGKALDVLILRFFLLYSFLYLLVPFLFAFLPPLLFAPLSPPNSYPTSIPAFRM